MGNWQSEHAAAANTSDPDDADDLKLAESTCPSRTETEMRSRILPPVSETPEPRMAKFQFPISGIMLLTLAVAIGLGGRHWMSAKIFAGVLVMIANVIIFSIEINGSDDPRLDVVVYLLCAASAAAIVVALLL